MDLVSLSTGVTSPEKIKNDLLNAEYTGEKKLKEFIHERLVDQTEFFD